MDAQSEALERNKRRPRIVVAASKRGTCPRLRMIFNGFLFDDGYHASAKSICVVRVVPTADSRTERLRVLLQRLATVTVSLVRTLSSRR